MFCKHCGQKLEDGALVCPSCGAAVDSQSGDVLQSTLHPSAPVSAAPAEDYAPAGGTRGPELEAPKHKKNWILPAAIGGVAVLCIVAAVLLSGIFSGAKGDLTKAVIKSVGAWQAASDTLELPDMAALRKEQSASQRTTIQIKDLSDQFGAEAQMLEGMSVTMAGGSDLKERKLNFSLGASYGPAELFSMQIWGEDSVLTMACPALLGEQVYGCDTETLGRDLARLDPDDAEELGNVSFNIFDVAEAYAKPMEIDAAATKALDDAMEVEKNGSATMDINGTSLKCDAYHVTFPQQAMLDYLDAVRDAYDAQEKNQAILDLYRSFGASDEELAAVREQLRNADMFEELEDLLLEAGDLELDVYVNDGYVAAVIYEGDGEFLHAYFGGGENYADDFSLEIQTEEDNILFTSSGNHSASDGAYTDTTTLAIDSRSLYLPQVTSQLTYDPKQPSDNFSWELSCEGITLTAKGKLTSGKDNLFLDLDQFSFSVLGTEYARLGLSWSVGPYDYAESAQGAPTMLEDMTADDLSALSYEVSVNAQNWLMSLMNDVPELFQLFM